VDAYISNCVVSNWRARCVSPAFIGIETLANINSFLIENVWIEELTPETTQFDISTFTVFTDSTNNNARVQLGPDSLNNCGLIIKNYAVGNTLDADN
jgi:hypothetical protein